MKYLLTVLASLVFMNFSIANELGKEVSFYSDEVGPQFGVVFAYDSDHIWTTNFTLVGGRLSPDFNIKTVSWRLFNSDTKKYLTSWTSAIDNSIPVMYPGTIAFSIGVEKENIVVETINSLKSLKLVFSVNQGMDEVTGTHFLDLGKYCVSHPKHFVNLTTSTPSCDLK